MAHPKGKTAQQTEEEARTRWARHWRAKQGQEKAIRGSPYATAAPRSNRPAVSVTPAVGALAAPPIWQDQVTVSLPTWAIPRNLLERAVRSLLTQTHRNLRIVIVSDGEKRPSVLQMAAALREDPRVVVVDSPHHKGPYFNHDAVLRTAGALFAIQDADDESHPRRFELQLARMLSARADACFSPLLNVMRDGQRTRSSASTAVSGSLEHRADQFGLYSTAALLAMGGYHAGFHVGFDSVITSTVSLLGHTCVTSEPLYTRHKRSGSLTTSSGMGHHSKFRAAQRAALAQMYDEVCRASRTSVAAGVARHREIAQARSASVAGARADLIARIQAARAARPWPQPPATDVVIEAVLNAVAWSDWSISRALAKEIYLHCERTKPKRILDVGSGASTVALALYAARNPGVKIVSLEHDAAWCRSTCEMLVRAGLGGVVDLRHATLRGHAGPRAYRWYDADPGALFEGPIDFMFVDGPPAREGGRHGAMLRSPAAFGVGSQIWMHDGERPDERDAVAVWKKARTMTATLSKQHDVRGVWQLQVTG